jgi:hypothetical protein
MLKRVRDHVRSNVVGYIALFFALGLGSAWAATELGRNSVGSRQIEKNAVKAAEIAKNAVRKAEVRKNAVATGEVVDGSLLERDFAPGQLPPGPQGERGPQGETGAPGAPGATGQPGATNVVIRTSGEGTAGFGQPASGSNGGNGGDATCTEAGCVLALGGAGGDAGGGGTGGSGGSATCGVAGCTASGGAGGGVSGGPDPGEGAAVGLRASCLAGERAVGGGARTSARDAVVYRSQPATTTSTDPSAGATPDAWYVEAYNQSRAGEGRTGVNVTVRAYVICAAP